MPAIRSFLLFLLAAALLCSCACAEVNPRTLLGEWHAGDDPYRLEITEACDDYIGFELTCLRINSFPIAFANLTDGSWRFTVYDDFEERFVMDGEIAFMGDDLVMHFESSTAEYLERLSGETLVFERAQNME